jgi:nucleoid-associated protein YgaU
METPVIITTLVAASALIPALVGAAARAPRHLRAPLLRLRRPLVVMLLLVAGLRAPASAATPPPQDRLQLEEDPDSDSEPGRILAETPSVRGYLVQPGDSLWAIACRTLEARTGDNPTNAQVDRFWKLIYQANRDQVGADPDLIFAGQDLVLPEEV